MFAVVANHPRRARFSLAPAGGDGNLSWLEPGSATLAGLLGLTAFAVDGLS